MKFDCKFVAILFASALLVSLAGCLGGSSEKSDQPSVNNPPPTNRAPSISGNPASAVIAGNSYSFTPGASDPDGDALTFSITNRPTWASFDNSTGTLTGIPTLGNVGLYSGINISVSDGSLSSSLPGFSVDVTQTALGSVTLSWTAPTQNTDGTPLSNLTAYKIYYGTSAGSYPNQVRIDNPGITSYVVDNLVPDTYFFVSTAINATGVESGFSNMASKVVN
jgi:hypothetical protein